MKDHGYFQSQTPQNPTKTTQNLRKDIKFTSLILTTTELQKKYFLNSNERSWIFPILNTSKKTQRFLIHITHFDSLYGITEIYSKFE